MISLDDPRMRLARQAVGAVRIIAEPALPPRLLHVVDSHGQSYIAKRHSNAHRFDQELRAYTTYLTELRDITPQLVAHHASSLSLLLSLVPGRDCDGFAAESEQQVHVHYQAGAGLRRLHESAVGTSAGPVGHRLAERTHQWIDRADQGGLLSRSERQHLHSAALQMAGTTMDSAICHLDYQPRNWRLHPDGRLIVLDFEHTRPDSRVRDFARLEHRHWSEQPHLREAFFIGYGRPLASTEQQLLHLFGAVEAVTALVRGHENGDPALHAHGRTLLTRLF